MTTNDFRNGMVFSSNNEIFEVLEFLHVKPGKGPAFVRSKLKNLRTGAIFERTFRSEEKIDQIRLDEKQMEYLYKDKDEYVFMDTKTYEQIQITENVLGDAVNFLKENIVLSVLFYGYEILGINLPFFLELEVTYAEPGVKGDTVSGGTKPVTLETGAVVQAPLFIERGDKIKVDTRTKTYVERVK